MGPQSTPVSIFAPINRSKTLPREGKGAIMLSQKFDLEIEVSGKHLNRFMGQCGAVLNPNVKFNMSKQVSNRIKSVTGQDLTMGFNRSKHEQNKLSKQDTLKKG